MKFKKKIAEFTISTLEYPFASSFILTKALSSFGIKFAPKKYFGDKVQENKKSQYIIFSHCKTIYYVMGYSASQREYFRSLWVIVGHCGLLWVIVAHSGSQHGLTQPDLFIHKFWKRNLKNQRLKIAEYFFKEYDFFK